MRGLTSRADRVRTAHWPDDRPAVLLIRPDGYIALAADDARPTREAALTAALDRWTGPASR
jgi:hypothetical protein